ncbi:MAG: N-formylglutamate amidohydrolase [Zetaproteobacteria bacterium]|nr:MAG: N-formylglutamate amidohydrolase [Zetaproteobacteria bacterium]
MKKMVKPDIIALYSPENALPVIFDSPHSGTIYPENFKYDCDLQALKRIEDRYVDELFACVPDYNATLLCALFPRSYIDVNRAANDIDDTLFDGVWPKDTHGTIKPSARSNSGIGLITRLTKPGFPIYARKLTTEEIMNRIKTYYEPYHDTLRTILDTAYYNHGKFWHINCHSMPRKSAYPKRNIMLYGNLPKPSDIVLGDRDGQSCGRDFLYALRDFWQVKGYRVTINDPFKGVELISRYAQPTRGKNSIQIEINRALYMDEETGEKSQNFTKMKNDCTDMAQFCTTFARSKLTNIAAD